MPGDNILTAQEKCFIFVGISVIVIHTHFLFGDFVQAGASYVNRVYFLHYKINRNICCLHELLWKNLCENP